MSVFCWRWFDWCTIRRLSNAFLLTQNISANGALSSEAVFSLQLCGVFSLGNFEETSSASCLSHAHRTLPSTNLHISVFHACTTHPKEVLVSTGSKSFSYSWKKSERSCLLRGFFGFFSPQITKFETLRSYPNFQNALLIFLIFRNNYDKAVTVGMYAGEEEEAERWDREKMRDRQTEAKEKHTERRMQKNKGSTYHMLGCHK